MSVYRVGTNKSSTNVFPSIRPSLDLDFANTKTLDPRITFTRASGGSYVGADGLIKYAGVNEARFDHDPETGESLGLLIEEARTNSLLRSEEFDNAYWAKERSSIVPNTIGSPDGNISADNIIENTENSLHRVSRGITFSTAGSYTFSVFVKAKERTEVDIRGFNTTDGNQFVVRFSLIDGSVISSNTQNFSIIKYPNNWYRFSGTGTFGARFTQFFAGPSIGNEFTYQGDGTSGIYIWGAQLEQGSFPTSYIPTQASSRTRQADTNRILGDNFKAFYNPNEFTMQCIFSRFSNNTPPYVLAISSSGLTNTALPSIRIRTDNNRRVQGQAVSSNNIVVYNNTVNPFLNINQVCNSAIAVKSGSTIYSDSGKLAPESNILGPFDGATTMHISSGGARINGHIRLVRYFSKRLPNQQLRALTR